MQLPSAATADVRHVLVVPFCSLQFPCFCVHCVRQYEQHRHSDLTSFKHLQGRLAKSACVGAVTAAEDASWQ